MRCSVLIDSVSSSGVDADLGVLFGYFDSSWMKWCFLKDLRSNFSFEESMEDL